QFHYRMCVRFSGNFCQKVFATNPTLLTRALNCTDMTPGALRLRFWLRRRRSDDLCAGGILCRVLVLLVQGIGRRFRNVAGAVYRDDPIDVGSATQSVVVSVGGRGAGST